VVLVPLYDSHWLNTYYLRYKSVKADIFIGHQWPLQDIVFGFQISFRLEHVVREKPIGGTCLLHFPAKIPLRGIVHIQAYVECRPSIKYFTFVISKPSEGLFLKDVRGSRFQ
jgi:hypothetical protein